MWNSDKSVVLSSICTKLVLALLVFFAAAAPLLVGKYIFYTGKLESITVPLLCTIYTCCIPAMAILVCLDCLLNNVKHNEIFIKQNVKLFRWISWCCFAVAFILVVSGFYYIFFVFAGVVAIFLGLMIRVVKNIFQVAIALKQENDFTI